MELRESILRYELQRELASAKALEASGKISKAGVHYIKAGAIYRRLAYTTPTEKAEEMFSRASQYESLGNTIKERGVPKILREAEEKPDVHLALIDSLIVTEKPETEWNDIGGLKEAKRIIKESVILPFIENKPEYIQAPKTILLYGPPGTGKTLLAKAACRNLNATFFEARLPNLLSKYYGESTKLVNALFEKARKTQPSLIFIDELDALAVSREDISEATRRVLSQLLQEMDGFGTRDEKILIMGATNRPWDLDEAMLSRFQKRVYIPLPDNKARRSIFKIHLKGADITPLNPEELAEKTEGFSGRDIASLCQEAVMNMVREQNPTLEALTAQQIERYSLITRPLQPKDFEASFEKTKPITKPEGLARFEDWKKDFGG